VIVAPREDIAIPPEAIDPFAEVQVLGIGTVTSSNAARVAGIRVARADRGGGRIAASGSIGRPRSWRPRPGYRRSRTVAAQRQSGTAVSWAFLAEYGRWVGGPPSGARATTARTGATCCSPSAISSALFRGRCDQEMLRQRGARLYLEPAARRTGTSPPGAGRSPFASMAGGCSPAIASAIGHCRGG
jgi:hypothetical protein